MKTIAIAALALTNLAQADFTLPVVRPTIKNVRLELKLTPLAGLAGAGTTTLSVQKNGRVTVREQRPIFPGGNVTKVVTRLSRNEMELLETYIADARDGEIMVRRPHFVCRAMGSHIETLTADNGRILLHRALEICPSEITYNSDPAAEKLIAKLRSLYQVYVSQLPIR